MQRLLLSAQGFLRLLPWVAVLAPLAACVPPAPAERFSSARLLVANALDGTVTIVDPHRAAATEPAIPVGPAPWQIGEGPGGGLVILSSAVDEIGRLTYATPPVRGGGAWAVRHIPIGLRLRSGYLAADGVRYAVIAFSQPAQAAGAAGAAQHGAFCGVEVVDLIADRVTGTHGVCAAGREAVTGLALTTGPSGTVAVVGVGHSPVESVRRADGLGNRLVALDVRTGHVLASAFVAGVPSNLVVARDPAGLGARLYCLLTPPDSVGEQRPDRATLQAVDPDTLAPRRRVELALFPRRLVVSSDGLAAYALSGSGTALLHVDLASGGHRQLADLPAEATDLAVAADAVFVPHAYGASVWRFDPLTGALNLTIPTGRHPTSITHSSR